jgi:uncharacterized membrane protein
MGENHFAMWPVFAYGVVLLLAAAAYALLVRALLAINGGDSALAKAVGKDIKGKLSVLIYIASLSLAFIHPYLSLAGYVAVAIIWFVPDKRMENALGLNSGDARAYQRSNPPPP